MTKNPAKKPVVAPKAAAPKSGKVQYISLLEKAYDRALTVAHLVKFDKAGEAVISEADRQKIADAGADLIHKIVVERARDILAELDMGDQFSDDDAPIDGESDEFDSGSNGDSDLGDMVSAEMAVGPGSTDGSDLDSDNLPVMGEDGDVAAGDKAGELTDADFQAIRDMLGDIDGDEADKPEGDAKGEDEGEGEGDDADKPEGDDADDVELDLNFGDKDDAEGDKPEGDDAEGDKPEGDDADADDADFNFDAKD